MSRIGIEPLNVTGKKALAELGAHVMQVGEATYHFKNLRPYALPLGSVIKGECLFPSGSDSNSYASFLQNETPLRDAILSTFLDETEPAQPPRLNGHHGFATPARILAHFRVSPLLQYIRDEIWQGGNMEETPNGLTLYQDHRALQTIGGVSGNITILKPFGTGTDQPFETKPSLREPTGAYVREARKAIHIGVGQISSEQESINGFGVYVSTRNGINTSKRSSDGELAWVKHFETEGFPGGVPGIRYRTEPPYPEHHSYRGIQSFGFTSFDEIGDFVTLFVREFATTKTQTISEALSRYGIPEDAPLNSYHRL